jgi:phosphopentomutase
VQRAGLGHRVIARLGAEHIATKKPIVYTSADIGLPGRRARAALRPRAPVRDLRIAREILDPYGVGRVIARPFVGEPAASSARTTGATTRCRRRRTPLDR